MDDLIQIVYPDKELINDWMEYLADENQSLKLKLPVIDDGWSDHILSIMELCRIPYYPASIADKAAHIFYKIIKNHNYIDSNKRSAVVIVYLFLLINNFTLKEAIRYRSKDCTIQACAKKVADTRSSMHKRTVKELGQTFRVSVTAN